MFFCKFLFCLTGIVGSRLSCGLIGKVIWDDVALSSKVTLNFFVYNILHRGLESSPLKVLDQQTVLFCVVSFFEGVISFDLLS